MQNIIITGATSMIGMALIEYILERGDIENIYAVIRPDSKRKNRIPRDRHIKIIECDISDYEELSHKIPCACEVFYHFAWGATGKTRNESVSYQSVQIGYTINALHAAHKLGCNKFIGAGSQAEYGLLDLPVISPDSPVNPIQIYGIAKYAAGKMILEEGKRLGMDCLWVRIFSTYGRWDKDSSMISVALEKMLKGERASFTRGEQIWDYLYSADAGEAFYLIGEKATGQKVYCLGSGTGKKLVEYILEMRNAVNSELEIGLGDIPYSENTVMNLCADISLLQEDTGWFPRVSFRQGIINTIEHLRKITIEYN